MRIISASVALEVCTHSVIQLFGLYLSYRNEANDFLFLLHFWEIYGSSYFAYFKM